MDIDRAFVELPATSPFPAHTDHAFILALLFPPQFELLVTGAVADNNIERVVDGEGVGEKRVFVHFGSTSSTLYRERACRYFEYVRDLIGVAIRRVEAGCIGELTYHRAILDRAFQWLVEYELQLGR